MNDIILGSLGVAAGTYFAEPVRIPVTVFRSNKSKPVASVLDKGLL